MHVYIYISGNAYIYITGIFIEILTMLGRVNFKESVMFKIVHYILYDMTRLLILSKKLTNIFLYFMMTINE